jgi:PAS domain S-box-containing protein
MALDLDQPAPGPARGARVAVPKGSPESFDVERTYLNALLTDVPAIIAILRGQDHVFEFVNREFCSMASRSADDLLGKKIREAMPEYEEQGFFELLDDVYKSGKTHSGQNRPAYVDRGNSRLQIFVSFVFRPFFNAAGGVEGVMIYAHDVSDQALARLKVEELARTAEIERARLSTLIDNIPAGVILAEAPDGRIVLSNRRVREILLSEIEHGTGLADARNWIGFYADGRRLEAGEWPLVRAIRGETVSGEEIHCVRGDGTRVWVRISAAPVHGQDGETKGAVVVFYDVDDQRKSEEARRAAESALGESERQFRLLAESMPQLVWTTQPDGYHDYFNQRWHEYMGPAFDDTRGDSWSRLLHPDDRQRTIDRWKSSLRTGEDYEIEYRYRRASDGTYRWFLGRAVPLHDSTGRIVRWFGTCTDIHDQKLAEAALRRSNEDLEQFAYAASHDLQEPLRMVAIYSQLLQRRYAERLDPEAESYITNIVSGAQRMEMLLNDLRNYMQAAAVPEPQDARPSCDAARVLTTVLANLEAAIGKAGAKVRSGALPSVAVEDVHMQQILQNLISNAVKYHREETPEIEISAQRAGSEWLFLVSDNGIGIDPKYARQIFGVFKRLHGQKYPGTGIGLAICQKIIERYGGHIWVKSEAGKGSTFLFTVPAAEESHERRQATP